MREPPVFPGKNSFAAMLAGAPGPPFKKIPREEPNSSDYRLRREAFPAKRAEGGIFGAHSLA